MKLKTIDNIKQIQKKIRSIDIYLQKCKLPTYKDFLYFANITSQDFTFLYNEIINNNEKAKNIYYVLERIKTKFEVNMEKMLIYQNNDKFNYNYKILSEIYKDSVKSPISLEFKDVNVNNINFLNVSNNNKNLLAIPKNETDIDLFNMKEIKNYD